MDAPDLRTVFCFYGVLACFIGFIGAETGAGCFNLKATGIAFQTI